MPHLDWSQLLSRSRLGKTAKSTAADNNSFALRSAFQRDFDRIVFSSAFRRLQDKTQVFPLARNDYVRTRLTHSLEVSSVGRSLGTLVGDSVIRRHALSDVVAADFATLVAAACLAHDIGNPPFGHAGEDAMRLWFAQAGAPLLQGLTPEQQADLLRFEGNAQGFRLLTRLQSPDNPGGMQLTHATLGVFSKYPCVVTQAGQQWRKFGVFQDDLPAFEEVAQQLGLFELAPGAWCRHPLTYLVEAADDICYLVIDTEDACGSGILEYSEVLERLLPMAGDVDARLNAMTRDKERVEYLRARCISRLIEQVHSAFMQYEAELLRAEFSGALLDRVAYAPHLQALKRLAEAKVYVARPVIEVGVGGLEVLERLMQAFGVALEEVATLGAQASTRSRMRVQLIPEQFLAMQRQPPAQRYQRCLQLTDFISGMTDSYAVSVFRQLTGMGLERHRLLFCP